ncbi:MAG: hypothetical protein KBB32_07750 [Spirochaetia bacterium]|nr:hypothetical protein [Spirochaetia bacterium]
MGSTLIELAVFVALCLVMVAWTRATVRRYLNADEALASARKEISALIIELDGTTDRNVTLVEDRLGQLKDALKEADKRISLLAREAPSSPAREPSRSQGTAPRIVQTSRPEQRAPERKADDAAQVPESRQVEAYRKASREGPQAGAAPDVPFIRFASKALPVDVPFPEKVASLRRKGFSAELIASELGAPLAEVEIAIAMEDARRLPEN